MSCCFSVAVKVTPRRPERPKPKTRLSCFRVQRPRQMDNTWREIRGSLCKRHSFIFGKSTTLASEGLNTVDLFQEV